MRLFRDLWEEETQREVVKGKPKGLLRGQSGEPSGMAFHQDRAVYLTPVVGPATRRETLTPRTKTGTTWVKVPPVVPIGPRMPT